MSDTVVLPAGARRRRKGPFIPPLLVIPFIVYNVLGFTLFGGSPDGWSKLPGIIDIPMVSGVTWSMTWGDLLLVVGLVCLFFEMLKSTNTGRSSLPEHMLSTLLLIVFIIEFILLKVAANSVFFLLTIMSLVDVVAGFSIAITGAERDVSMD